MVVQGPAWNKEVALPRDVPVDFMTAGRTNDVLQSTLPPSGHLLAWGKQHQDALLAAALGRELGGRVGQGWPVAIRSSSPLGHLQCLEQPVRAGSPLTLPGWSCGAGERCLTCLDLFDLEEKTTSVFPESPVTASGSCSHQYQNKRRIKLRWVKWAPSWMTGWLSLQGFQKHRYVLLPREMWLLAWHGPHVPTHPRAGLLTNLPPAPTPPGDLSLQLKVTR